MENLKNILDKLIKSSDDYKHRDQLRELSTQWATCVGATIHANTKILYLQNDGLLVIAAAHSIWAQQLKMLEPQILQKLNLQLKKQGKPTVRGLRFKVQALADS